MDQSLKPGKAAGPKIKLPAKPPVLARSAAHPTPGAFPRRVRFAVLPPRTGQAILAGVVLLSMLFSSLACSWEFYYPVELTATAAALEANPNTVVSGQNLGIVTITPYVPQEEQLPTDITLPGLTTPTPPSLQPVSLPTAVPPTRAASPDAPLMYYTQAGDTLRSLAIRFNVLPEEITSPSPIPQEGLFDPGILLLIPPHLSDVSSSRQLIPDSEVVYSPSALDLDINKFVAEAGGYLSTYREWRVSGWHSGAQVIQRVAIENSINPRLLLAVLETQSQWVYGQPPSLAQTDFPIGWKAKENERKDLYYQLSWAVYQLNVGYYGWRDGSVTSLTFPNGETLRLAPDLNAGTVGVLFLFSRLYNQPQWAGILYGPDGLVPLYERMFGNPYLRAQSVEPLFPATLTQPPLQLPFPAGQTWSLTGGPHSAWQISHSEVTGARAALDFAPSTTQHGCYDSNDWVTASASGLVVRSDTGLVVIDLDSDGYEQTGWALLYLHIATKDRVALGTFVSLNDRIGHPSCEGGVSNGTHVHIARKYNGEWILADGPMPFVLSGYRAHADKEPYKGRLTKDDLIVYASEYGSFESRVTRPLSLP